IDQDHIGERFIISSENLPYQTVFSKIGIALGMKTHWKPLTPRLSYLAWRWEKIKSWFTGSEPAITYDQAKSMRTRSHYNAAKSENKLGLKYRNVESAVHETAQKYLESVKGKNSFSMLDF